MEEEKSGQSLWLGLAPNGLISSELLKVSHIFIKTHSENGDCWLTQWALVPTSHPRIRRAKEQEQPYAHTFCAHQKALLFTQFLTSGDQGSGL